MKKTQCARSLIISKSKVVGWWLARYQAGGRGKLGTYILTWLDTSQSSAVLAMYAMYSKLPD